MVSLTVSGPGTMLFAMVSALIRETHAGAEIQPGAHSRECAGVHVGLLGTSRWLFISTTHGPAADAVQALSSGACAALTLDSSPEEFRLAMKALLDGERGYVPIEMVRWMAGEALGRTEGGPSARAGLTVREREILQLVARGHSNAEIARALLISPNTVRTHVHALSVKLEATSRTRMLARARALAIPEAFEFEGRPTDTAERVSA
jgi:DNA-binding CsgD family transcriptional regulator